MGTEASMTPPGRPPPPDLRGEPGGAEGHRQTGKAAEVAPGSAGARAVTGTTRGAMSATWACLVLSGE